MQIVISKEDGGGTHDQNTLAALLKAAYKDRRAIPPLRHIAGETDVAAAYAIQEVNTRAWERAGRAIAGAKIGLTAKSVQKQLGVDQPDYGILFSDMEVKNNGIVSAGVLLQPKVEAEVAFMLSRNIDKLPGSLGELASAVATAHAAIEIVDSRIADWDISLFDTIADNASSAMYVISEHGVPLDRLDLALCGMVLAVDGEDAVYGAGAACLGNPLTALSWLARTMIDVGRPLRAGDVVLSGALGPMTPAAPGRHYRATINGLGSVGVEFAA